jgi:hypothetical protein
LFYRFYNPEKIHQKHAQFIALPAAIISIPEKSIRNIEQEYLSYIFVLLTLFVE